MAVVMISGSGRGAGKTAVGCALIRVLTEWMWTAIKITPHRHAEKAAVLEETDAESGKDTGRYLAAGAWRALLVTLLDGEIDRDKRSIVTEMLQESSDGRCVLLEGGEAATNVLREYGGTVIQVVVLAADPETWKPAVQTRLSEADGVVLTGTLEVRSQLPAAKPVFVVPRDEWMTDELAEWVRERLRVS